MKKEEPSGPSARDPIGEGFPSIIFPKNKNSKSQLNMFPFF
jgi:hypothetical protein